MRCEDLQQDLAIYVDKMLDESRMDLLKAHLQKCPICRQKLSELIEIRMNLRRLREPSVSSSFVSQVRRNTALELQSPSKSFSYLLQSYLIPYAAGVVISLFAFIFFLLSLFSTDTKQRSDVLLAYNSARNYTTKQDNLDIVPTIASKSPSLNPEGSLVSFSRSFMHQGLYRGEMVIVADVFSNGVARVFEVVQPTQDQKVIEALKKALEAPDHEAAFLPANVDQRSDIVRVVLKIRSVEVVDKIPKQKLKSKSKI